MDLARLRAAVALGSYTVDPVAVADAVLRVPDLVRLLGAPRPATP